MVSAVSSTSTTITISRTSGSGASQSATAAIQAELSSAQSELASAKDESTKADLTSEIASLKAELAAAKAAEKLQATFSGKQTAGSSDSKKTEEAATRLSGESENIGTTNFDETTPFGEREAWI